MSCRTLAQRSASAGTQPDGTDVGVLTVDGKVASTTLETSGAATVGGDLTLSNTAAVAITHSGTTSLSISSTGGYVAVESVQFADANIGISGDTDLMRY